MTLNLLKRDPAQCGNKTTEEIIIITDRFKYVRYLEGCERGRCEELYGMLADPGETRTLIGDPAYAAVLEAHRTLLKAHVKATGDGFYQLAWEADRRWRSHEPGYANHVGPAAPMAG